MAQESRPRNSAAAGARSPYDAIRRPPPDRSLGTTLQLIRTGVGIVWEADRSAFIRTAIAQVVGALALTFELVLAERLLDAIVDPDRQTFLSSDIGFLFAGLVAVTVMLGVASGVQNELALLLGERVGRQAADRVLDVTGAVELDAYERPGFFDRLQRARFTATARNMTVARSILGLIGAGMASAGVVAALLAVAPLLVPIGLLVIVPLWFAASRNSRAFHQFTHSMTASDRERNYLWNALTEKDFAKEVRAYGSAPFLRSRHDALYDGRIQQLRGLVSYRMRRTLVGSVAASGFTAATLAALLWMIDRSWLTLGGAGAALLGSLVLGQRVRSALNHVAHLYESSLFLEDYTTFLDLMPLAEERELPQAPPGFDLLEVEELTFTYPEASKPAVAGLDLTIRAGEVVALVGENGSGKTTTAKLLAGLHRPTSGRILWDGVDVSAYGLATLREAVTVVFQDFVRWYLPARLNIGLGRVRAMDDENRIRAAARKAEADAFISELDEGYDTVLSRLFAGGTDLSLGQWQRMALARAFFRDAPFVIMDEPTAALDPLAEYKIFQTVREALHGHTVLLISHRFSSVVMADRIYVLSEGRVVEAGSHDELMSRNGHYARLFSLQAAAYLGEDAEPV